MTQISGKSKDKGPKEPNIEVVVDDNKYEAYPKDDLPADGEYTVGNTKINIVWFANFGVREKASNKEANVSYTVKLRLPAGKKIFLWEKQNNRVIEVTQKQGNDSGHLKYSDDDDAKEKENNNGKKVKFTWNVGDPPIGFGP